MKESLKKGAQLLLGFVSAGIAKGGEFDFHCPCEGTVKFPFYFVYLLGPAIAMLIFGIYILRQNKDWNVGSFCYGVIFSCLAPPVVWMVMFFNGKYMECFKDRQKEGQTLCEVQLDFYAKRAGGICVIILLFILGLIYDCCKKK